MTHETTANRKLSPCVCMKHGSADHIILFINRRYLTPMGSPLELPSAHDQSFGCVRRFSFMGKRKAFLFYGTVQRLFFIAARSEGNKNGHGRRPASKYHEKIAAQRLF